MRKKDRVPPNQRVVYDEFPILHIGPVPHFNPAKWDFMADGLISIPLRVNHSEFLRLPTAVIVADFHCVTAGAFSTANGKASPSKPFWIW